MIRRPPRSTRTVAFFPQTPRLRSGATPSPRSAALSSPAGATTSPITTTRANACRRWRPPWPAWSPTTRRRRDWLSSCASRPNCACTSWPTPCCATKATAWPGRAHQQQVDAQGHRQSERDAEHRDHPQYVGAVAVGSGALSEECALLVRHLRLEAADHARGLEHVAAHCRARPGQAVAFVAQQGVGQLVLAQFEIGRAHVELQSLMRISYAVFCLKKQTT